MNLTRNKRRWIVALAGMGILMPATWAGEKPNGVFPNDPLFPLQWHLHNTGQLDGKPGADINAVKAWEITTGDPSVIVAILGEGIDLDHPDLVNNLAPGIDFFDQDDSPYPGSASGLAGETMAAGLIAAEGNNGLGVAGVTWHCKIMPVRTMNEIDTHWGEPISAANEAAAWRWAATHGAEIIYYGWLGGNNVPTAVRSALLDISKPRGIGRNGKGCVLVVPARANQSEPGYVYPGAYAETISVDAVDPWGKLWGTHVAGSRVDLVAPIGQNPVFGDPAITTTIPMWTTDIEGPAGVSVLDYTDQAGMVTSASASVAGVAALILSVEPSLTNEEVRHYLCRSAHDLGDPRRDEIYGWGRVDARAALDMVLAKRADLNNDWVVDEQDLALLTAALEAKDRSADIAPAKRDGVADAKDEALLKQYLGTEIPEPGLIAHWRLDETAGITVADSVGPYHGTVFGSPTWQPTGGKRGGALKFDGALGFVITKFVCDPSQGPLSVFAWVRGGGPGQVILSQQNGRNWLMCDPACRLMTDLHSASAVRFLAARVVIADDQWHRVGLVWDGTTRILYVDGSEVARDTGASPASSSSGLQIGGAYNLAPGTFWSGLIDDIRLYDRAVKP